MDRDLTENLFTVFFFSSDFLFGTFLAYDFTKSSLAKNDFVEWSTYYCLVAIGLETLQAWLYMYFCGYAYNAIIFYAIVVTLQCLKPLNELRKICCNKKVHDPSSSQSISINDVANKYLIHGASVQASSAIFLGTVFYNCMLLPYSFTSSESVFQLTWVQCYLTIVSWSYFLFYEGTVLTGIKRNLATAIAHDPSNIEEEEGEKAHQNNKTDIADDVRKLRNGSLAVNLAFCSINIIFLILASSHQGSSGNKYDRNISKITYGTGIASILQSVNQFITCCNITEDKVAASDAKSVETFLKSKQQHISNLTKMNELLKRNEANHARLKELQSELDRLTSKVDPLTLDKNHEVKIRSVDAVLPF